MRMSLSMQNLRKVVQIGFLLFFILLFLVARYPYEPVIGSDFGLQLSPLIPLFTFIETLSLPVLIIPGLIILILTPFLGRFFCSWICPLGTTLDATDKLIKTPSNKLSRSWDRWRYLKFANLIALILMAILSLNLWGYLDPLSIFNRMLTVLLYPIATLFTENVLLWFSEIPFLETPAYFLYDLFRDHVMPEGQAYYQQVLLIALFTGAILAAEKLSRRFWCRYLCPAGALLGFLSQFRFYERLVGEECPACNLCITECKMDAIPQDNVSQTNKVECIECFNCGAACPPKVKAITYRWRWTPYHTKLDLSRRQILGGLLGGLGTLGLVSLGLPNRNHERHMIRPPGSLAEAEFEDKCIRCLECVRICESNGGCLQPDVFHSSLTQLWLPAAQMRTGYCEYNCNLCTQVCPTDAIEPLTLGEKQGFAMGTAYFREDLCIPYAKDEDCIVCEEHCPTPEKAIKFETRLVSLPQGGERELKLPYVDHDTCIGCGICEFKCPLVRQAGIFVTKTADFGASENYYS